MLSARSSLVSLVCVYRCHVASSWPCTLVCSTGRRKIWPANLSLLCRTISYKLPKSTLRKTSSLVMWSHHNIAKIVRRHLWWQFTLGRFAVLPGGASQERGANYRDAAVGLLGISTDVAPHCCNYSSFAGFNYDSNVTTWHSYMPPNHAVARETCFSGCRRNPATCCANSVAHKAGRSTLNVLKWRRSFVELS